MRKPMNLTCLLVDVVRYMPTPRARIIEAILSEPEFNRSSINRVSESGWTALMHAVQSGHPEVVKLLLEAGAQPNVGRNSEGWTAITIAAEKGNKEVARLLIDAGADLTITDRKGKTLEHHNNFRGFMEFGQLVHAALYIK